MNAYERTLAELYALEAATGIDLKLDRVRRALAVLGSPERRFSAIHIAGTNGKGSTAAMLDAVLRRSGYRVGLYTSPHLVDFTERIRIDGRMVAEEEVVMRVAALRAHLDQVGIALTFFELVTVLAFDVFARHDVEIAVLEVGLGGRLDATNVVQPLVTAVTGIGLDHEEYLGRTVAAIAREKAGIMKPGVPTVIGPVSAEVAELLLQHAATVGAPADLVGRDVRIEDGADAFDVVTRHRRWRDLQLGLAGRFQRGNAAIAIAALERLASAYPVPPEAVREGLAGVYWPGRLDRIRSEPLLVLDGAHNLAGITMLRAEMEVLRAGRPVRLVFGAMQDKNWQGMWEALRPMVTSVVVTRPNLPRALAPGLLAAHVGGTMPVRAVDAPADAIAVALGEASADEVVLVTGSLFLVGAVYAGLLERWGRRHLFDPWRASASDVRHAPA